MNNNAYQNEQYNASPAAAPVRTIERKIGKATFTVSSRFNEGKKKDIVSTIARLIQYDSNSYGKPE